jgi:hypothetical protein
LEEEKTRDAHFQPDYFFARVFVIHGGVFSPVSYLVEPRTRREKSLYSINTSQSHLEIGVLRKTRYTSIIHIVL